MLCCVVLRCVVLCFIGIFLDCIGFVLYCVVMLCCVVLCCIVLCIPTYGQDFLDKT